MAIKFLFIVQKKRIVRRVRLCRFSFCSVIPSRHANEPTADPAMRELLMMKTRILAFCFLAVAGLIFSGCTTTTTTTETQTDQTTKRVHTQEELKKSGETNPAAALEKTDPSARTSGPR